METYKHSRSSVGANRKHVQITPKYRFKMMRQDKLKVFCKVAIEEACKKHKIEIEIVKVMDEHVHLAVDCPRTMCDAKMMQIIKGLSSYILFRICPNLRRDILTDIFGQQDISATELETTISSKHTAISKIKSCTTRKTKGRRVPSEARN